MTKDGKILLLPIGDNPWRNQHASVEDSRTSHPKGVIALFKRTVSFSATLALFLGITMTFVSSTSVAATSPVCQTLNSITSCDDTFDQATGTYEAVIGNTHIGNLPVVKNDPSNSLAGIQVCRYKLPVGANDWGYVHLTDGVLSVQIQPNYFTSADSAPATFSYQLCTSTEMGPVTTITIVVFKLHVIRSHKVGAHKMRLTNKNRLTATCNISPTKPWKRIAPDTSVVVRRHKWNCWIQQKIGIAAVGSSSGL